MLTDFNNSIVAAFSDEVQNKARMSYGGKFYSSFICSSPKNAAVKELLKLVNI